MYIICQNKALVSLRKTLIWGTLKYYQHYPSNYRTSRYHMAAELSRDVNLPYSLFCLVFTPYRISCPSTLHRTSLHRYLESHRTLPWVCRKCRQELIWKRMQRNLSMSWFSSTWLLIHVVPAKVHFRICTWGCYSQRNSGKKAVSLGKKTKFIHIQVRANFSSVVCTYPPVNLFFLFVCLLLLLYQPFL